MSYLKKLVQHSKQRSIVPRQEVFTREQLRAVSIVDNGEKLIPIPSHEKISYSKSAHSEEFILRESAVKRIIHVAEHLPENLKLVIIECYRSSAKQEVHRKNKYENIKNQNPDLKDEEVWVIVDQFVSRSGGPHQTGGAIDLTLAHTDTGELLDMGTDWGEASPKSWTNSEKVSWEAQCNRVLLWSHMRSAGFCNYAAEWWHWEFGTVRWALANGLDDAMYGAL